MIWPSIALLGALSFARPLLLVSAAPAQTHTTRSDEASRMQAVVDGAVGEALRTFAKSKLQSNDLAMTLIDLRDPQRPLQASYRGDAPNYPASVVKLFYLVAAYRWIEDGKLADTAELRRALHDMIVDSSNDATHYVLDSLTGTTGGPELPESEMRVWGEKRNAVNRYFAALGYTNINVDQKPWGDGPYGRERVFLGPNFENRNALTTDATARLLAEIALRRAVSPARSAEMLKLLVRDPWKRKVESSEPDQNYDFTGATMLPPGTKLWSKAGWTSTARHDAAYLELPDGRRFVVVIFTTGHAEERGIIPTIASKVLAGLQQSR